MHKYHLYKRLQSKPCPHKHIYLSKWNLFSKLVHVFILVYNSYAVSFHFIHIYNFQTNSKKKCINVQQDFKHFIQLDTDFMHALHSALYIGILANNILYKMYKTHITVALLTTHVIVYFKMLRIVNMFMGFRCQDSYIYVKWTRKFWMFVAIYTPDRHCNLI